MDIKEFILNEIKSINDKQVIDDYGTDLLMTEVLDSLGIVKLLASIENEYSIEIDADDIIPENFETINSIAKLIERYLD